MFARASPLVSRCEMHPGRVGHSATKTPSSCCSIKILYRIAHNLLFVRCAGMGSSSRRLETTAARRKSRGRCSYRSTARTGVSLAEPTCRTQLNEMSASATSASGRGPAPRRVQRITTLVFPHLGHWYVRYVKALYMNHGNIKHSKRKISKSCGPQPVFQSFPGPSYPQIGHLICFPTAHLPSCITFGTPLTPYRLYRRYIPCPTAKESWPRPKGAASHQALFGTLRDGRRGFAGRGGVGRGCL